MKYVDNTPWADIWPWSKRCKARKAPDSEPKSFFGRCELAPHGPEVMHTLERGMIWVRWKDGEVEWTSPDYQRVEDDDDIWKQR